MNEQSVKTASGINTIAGFWLMFFAYFMNLGFSSNEFIVGLIVAIVGLVGWFSTKAATWTSWVAGILGVWLLLTPLFVTGMTTGILWNSIILGIVIIAVSIWEGMSSSSSSTHGRGHGTPLGTR